jgi:hypothetical protein
MDALARLIGRKAQSAPGLLQSVASVHQSSVNNTVYLAVPLLVEAFSA